MYYHVISRGSDNVTDATLDTVSHDFVQRFQLSLFQAEWCLVVTWNLMEYPGHPNQVGGRLELNKHGNKFLCINHNTIHKHGLVFINNLKLTLSLKAQSYVSINSNLVFISKILYLTKP